MATRPRKPKVPATPVKTRFNLWLRKRDQFDRMIASAALIANEMNDLREGINTEMRINLPFTGVGTSIALPAGSGILPQIGNAVTDEASYGDNPIGGQVSFRRPTPIPGSEMTPPPGPDDMAIRRLHRTGGVGTSLSPDDLSAGGMAAAFSAFDNAAAAGFGRV